MYRRMTRHGVWDLEILPVSLLYVAFFPSLSEPEHLLSPTTSEAQWEANRRLSEGSRANKG